MRSSQNILLRFLKLIGFLLFGDVGGIEVEGVRSDLDKWSFRRCHSGDKWLGNQFKVFNCKNEKGFIFNSFTVQVHLGAKGSVLMPWLSYELQL